MGKKKGGKQRKGQLNNKNNNNYDKNEERVTRKQLKKERARNGQYGRHGRREEGRFEEQLNEKGCWIKVMNSDGNCMFRALGDQLEGNQNLHDDFRENIVSFMEANQEYFEPFMEDDEKFDDYIIRMRSQREWGGYQELYAASQLYKVHIVVHQLEAESLTFIYNPEDAEAIGWSTKSTTNYNKYFSAGEDIYTCHISYHGEFHYNSVRSLNEKQQNNHKRASELASLPARLPLNLEGMKAIDLSTLSLREEKVDPSTNTSTGQEGKGRTELKKKTVSKGKTSEIISLSNESNSIIYKRQNGEIEEEPHGKEDAERDIERLGEEAEEGEVKGEFGGKIRGDEGEKGHGRRGEEGKRETKEEGWGGEEDEGGNTTYEEENAYGKEVIKEKGNGLQGKIAEKSESLSTTHDDTDDIEDQDLKEQENKPEGGDREDKEGSPDKKKNTESKRKVQMLPHGKCPCGSGKKYRKCCKKLDKQIQALKEKEPGRHNTVSSSCKSGGSESGSKEKTEGKAFQSIIL